MNGFRANGTAPAVTGTTPGGASSSTSALTSALDAAPGLTGPAAPTATDDEAPPAISAKIVIAGGFGVGKTTLVRSVSEIPPLNTEAWMTEAGESIDDLTLSESKHMTTVTMDFGRISLYPDLILYLFGTPGQPRFWFLWDDLSRGALGAIVLVDSRRLEQSFTALNYFEHDSSVPFIVAINRFDGKLWHDVGDVREALGLRPEVPLVTCDARDSASTAQVLRDLVVHTLALARSAENPEAGSAT